MRTSFYTALLLAMGAAACGPGSPGAAAPVTVVLPVTAPATAEPAPPEPPDEKLDAAIAGSWEEAFEGRSGCSDSVTIRGSRRSLVMEGKDCNDSAHYKFSDVKFDGTTLWFTLTVPETGYVLRYTMRRSPDGTMAGRAEITGSGPKEIHTIRWTRPPAVGR